MCTTIMFSSYSVTSIKNIHKKHTVMFPQNICHQWRTEGGGLGCSNPPRNSEDIGEVLDRVSKKNRRLDFVLQFTVFSYSCNLLNKGFF